jgi:hypothetical protein
MRHQAILDPALAQAMLYQGLLYALKGCRHLDFRCNADLFIHESSRW